MTTNVRLNETPIQLSDVAVGSDKQFTVPADEEWEISSILASATATATVGNRQFGVEIIDGSANVTARVINSANLAASGNLDVTFAPGLNDVTTAVKSTVHSSFPASLVLPAGYVIRVFDVNGIDAAGDTVIARVIVKKKLR